MPRGGPRPGAGRPKGSTSKGKKAPASKPEAKKKSGKGKAAGGKAVVVRPDPPPIEEVLQGEVLPANMTPLEYMLGVMNNRKAEADRRDRMAMAAAPYVHGKVGEQGKKTAKQAAATNATAGGRFSSAPPPRRSSMN